MAKFITISALYLTASIAGHPIHPKNTNNFPFAFVTREEWRANQTSSAPTSLKTPVPYLVIHHSYSPPVCMTRDQCMADMRAMQNFHQNTNGWRDIGYNFAVGGEGSVYEGRGWEAVGAHAAGFNAQSIGIVFIGDFVTQTPPAIALQTAKQLISVGVQLGHINKDYKLLGHRQVRATECPGEALFKEIKTWERYSSTL